MNVVKLVNVREVILIQIAQSVTLKSIEFMMMVLQNAFARIPSLMMANLKNASPVTTPGKNPIFFSFFY